MPQQLLSCTVNKASSTSTQSSTISCTREKKGQKDSEREGGGRWKPTLEELNYRSFFSLSFSRLLWPTSQRWCSHDPTQCTDILFNPASMKFLQIKPLCWATANYLTDWPPSGLGYSAEWLWFSPPPTHTTSNTLPALTHSPPASWERGHFEKNPRGPNSFQEIINFTPPLLLLLLNIYTSTIRQRGLCIFVSLCRRWDGEHTSVI